MKKYEGKKFYGTNYGNRKIYGQEGQDLDKRSKLPRRQSHVHYQYSIGGQRLDLTPYSYSEVTGMA